MSRGPGIVQRRIADAFEVSPDRRFTVEELAGVVYPGQMIERKHCEAVRRALTGMAQKLGLHLSRAGTAGQAGWRYRVGLPGK